MPVSLVYENETSVKASDVLFVEGRDVWWADAIPKQSTDCEVEWLDAEDPLFLLYTSGSTGGRLDAGILWHLESSQAQSDLALLLSGACSGCIVSERCQGVIPDVLGPNC